MNVSSLVATVKILAIKAVAFTRPTSSTKTKQVGLVNAPALIANIFAVATKRTNIYDKTGRCSYLSVKWDVYGLDSFYLILHPYDVSVKFLKES